MDLRCALSDCSTWSDQPIMKHVKVTVVGARQDALPRTP
ncbi:hypothetical protein EES39_29205 [Streptomyces sp. ADI92-24]|nr:hypothetical protein EES39_29205 [Streptomyces sp. ADI92-24]